MHKRILFIKNLIGVILCIAAFVWLIPTVFVRSTVYTVCEVKLTDDSAPMQDEYTLRYTYDRAGTQMTGTTTAVYRKGEVPQIGAQGKCHYYTFLKNQVATGDAPRCVPPLCLFGVGIVVLLIDKKPKEEANAN